MLNRKMLTGSSRIGWGATIALMAVTAGVGRTGVAQAANDNSKPNKIYVPIPGFDTTSLDTTIDPCNDFYKFACGKFVANHPIPADQPAVNQFIALFNVNTQSLNAIL